MRKRYNEQEEAPVRIGRDLAWGYWTATLIPLGMGLAGWPAGIPLAIVLGVIQVLHFAWREKSLTAFSVQVRLVFLGLLLLGLWPPLAVIHWVQFIGTTVRVLVSYCLLARSMALLPWNRTEQVSLDLLRRTYFGAAIRGCGGPVAPWMTST